MSSGFKENETLNEAYNWLEKDTSALFPFLEEILATIKAHVAISQNTSFLDIGCGKGLFLQYLFQKGYPNIQGIEPSDHLRPESTVTFPVHQGSFEKNPIADNAVDIVCTIHTLHHLPQSHPVYAIKEMLRMAKNYIVIVEVNNTNLPMFGRALVRMGMEVNCFRYNRWKVRALLNEAGSRIIYSSNMRASYLSGNSWLYHLLSKFGGVPYNIAIAEKRMT